MDVLVKITLVVSIAFMGYSLSEFLAVYKTVCKKAEEFKKLAQESGASEKNLRISNSLMTFGLSVGYLILLYFTEISGWLLAVIGFKLVLTLISSDISLLELIRCGFISKKMYRLTKFDSLLNVFLGMGLALIMVL